MTSASANNGRSIETPEQLRWVIRRLSPASPVTNRFTAARWKISAWHVARGETGVWYKTQQEHWLGWLREYSGPGAYGRGNWKRSAEFVYNHIVNPQMLVYL